MMSSRPHVVLVAVCMAVAACLSPSASPAQTTYTWDGEPEGGGTSADGNWTTATNWVSDTAPTDGSFNRYTFGGTTNLVSNNDLTPTAGGVNVDDVGFLSGAGAFTLTGVYLDMLGSTSNSDTADIVNNSASTQTIALRLEARPDYTTALVFDTAAGDIVVTGQVTSSSNSTTEYVRKTGDYTLTFSANNSYGSTTQVNEGALQITNGGALGATSAGTTVANNARLELSGGITVSGESLTIVGNGGDYYGAVRSVDGTNVWNGPVTLGSHGARIGATGGSILEIQGDISGGSYLLGVRTDTTSKVVLSGSSNSYGDTMVIAGTLQIDGGDDRLSTTGLLRMGNSSNVDFATFDLNGYNQQVVGLRSEGTTMTMTVTNTSGTASTLTLNQDADTTYAGGLTGALSLVKNGTGTLNLTGAASSSSSRHSGDTVVNGGTLALGNTGALLNSTLDTGASGSQQITFTVAGTNTYSLGGLKGSDDLDVGGNTISVGANGQSTTFSGVLSGAGGALTKTGSGTLTLAGDNDYTGPTTVSAGALRLTSATGLGSTSGDTTVANNARLELSGGITVTGESLTINGNGGDYYGALKSVAGVNEWAGSVTLGSDGPRIGATGGSTLVVSGAITGTKHLAGSHQHRRRESRSYQRRQRLRHYLRHRRHVGHRRR